MRASSFATVGLAATAALLATGLAVAPMAQAYPPGKTQKTTLNKSEIRQDGRFKAFVKNAQPGCRVKFTLVDKNGNVVDSRTGTVSSSGGDERQFSPAPSKTGTYTVIATVSGSGCAASESSSSITVVKR